jgi:DNA-directed RNA polymerase subunit omega
MNSELVKKALEKVTNPHVLVNLLSRRVRQLNFGAGGSGRPMVNNTENLGAADIALREIIEEKMGFDMPEIVELHRPTSRGRRKPQNWAQEHPPTNGNTQTRNGSHVQSQTTSSI